MPLFAPIIVGPVTDQRLCHADGELATVRGASAAQAAVAVSRRSSHSVQAMAAQATTPLIFQAFADDGPTKVRSQAQDAVRPIVDAVDAQVPVLRDGGIRRGTDVMKALASGARAVLVARPVMWGLAAYGADGVQSVIEMLQTELGRVMGCCGTPSLAAITNRVVKIHAAQPTRERV